VALHIDAVKCYDSQKYNTRLSVAGLRCATTLMVGRIMSTITLERPHGNDRYNYLLGMLTTLPVWLLSLVLMFLKRFSKFLSVFAVGIY